MRVFIAIDLPREITGYLAEITKEFPKTGIKCVSPKNMHITLRFIGETEEELVKKLIEELKVLEGFGKFEANLTGPGEFNKRVLWVGVKGEKFSDLKRITDAAVKKVFGLDEERGFIPHITLARIKRFESKWYVSQFLKRKIEKKRFLVDRVVVKKSILTPEGPIYEDMGVIQL